MAKKAKGKGGKVVKNSVKKKGSNKKVASAIVVAEAKKLQKKRFPRGKPTMLCAPSSAYFVSLLFLRRKDIGTDVVGLRNQM